MADSKDFADWVRYAEDGWRRGSRDVGEFPRGAGFDLQQSAEKYLEAVLVQRGVEPPSVHSLTRLLTMIDPTLPGNGDEVTAARLLTAIAVPGRYPGDLDEPTVPEAQATGSSRRGVAWLCTDEARSSKKRLSPTERVRLWSP